MFGETETKKRPTSLALRAIALFAVLGGTLISCNKEEAGPQGLVVSTEMDVTPRVLAFVDAARSEAQTKDDIYFSADSAEWYVEA